jgi:hypothetical protein
VRAGLLVCVALSGCTLGIQLCSRDSDCGAAPAACAPEGVCVELAADAGAPPAMQPDAGRAPGPGDDKQNDGGKDKGPMPDGMP